MGKELLNISCKDITLDVFIDCDCNGNYRRLHPTAGDEELKAAWGRISGEFSELIGNTKYKYTISLTQRAYVLQTKIEAAKLLLGEDTPKARELLRKIGYTGSDKNILALIKRDNILLKDYTNELNESKGSEGKPSTETDYEQWIVSVSKYMGFAIEADKITVSKFIHMNKLMVDSNKK